MDHKYESILIRLFKHIKYQHFYTLSNKIKFHKFYSKHHKEKYSQHWKIY